ncbi:hypothetical protein H2201_008329 [Coniosporium apollinis]|uniref:Metallo-beta-lactamase domain-containing protein n=1 Tax=Coniosporium apollinis TaxID=61459 RepID=A0ABQ9NIY9_9PEZI|nr:hypothetical protein H2201_008329 [Coniosporium apollinis]
MPLTVKSLNGDTTFLLTFSPPSAPATSPGLFPGSFTILIDPWLTGASSILHPKFQEAKHRKQPCIASLAELPEPDLVIVSQNKPDHCHEETLRQLPANCASTILAAPAAAKKIRGWNHFDPEAVIALQKFDEKRESRVFRLSVPSPSPSGSPGEVTIALLPPPKHDIARVHNAIGITYRPPFTVLSASTGKYIDLPATPPASPLSPISIKSATPKTLAASPYNDRERTLSVIYSPHGMPYSIIKPYASSHLVEEAALPLTCLFHSFDRVHNPWFLGGTVVNGMPGGLEIARNLLARVWVGAHDEQKELHGVATSRIKTQNFGINEINELLREPGQGAGPKVWSNAFAVSLEAGEEIRIGVSEDIRLI